MVPEKEWMAASSGVTGGKKKKGIEGNDNDSGRKEQGGVGRSCTK